MKGTSMSLQHLRTVPDWGQREDEDPPQDPDRLFADAVTGQ